MRRHTHPALIAALAIASAFVLAGCVMQAPSGTEGAPAQQPPDGEAGTQPVPSERHSRQARVP